MTYENQSRIIRPKIYKNGKDKRSMVRMEKIKDQWLVLLLNPTQL
jgi:hypothetical protein